MAETTNTNQSFFKHTESFWTKNVLRLFRSVIREILKANRNNMWWYKLYHLYREADPKFRETIDQAMQAALLPMEWALQAMPLPGIAKELGTDVLADVVNELANYYREFPEKLEFPKDYPTNFKALAFDNLGEELRGIGRAIKNEFWKRRGRIATELRKLATRFKALEFLKGTGREDEFERALDAFFVLDETVQDDFVAWSSAVTTTDQDRYDLKEMMNQGFLSSSETWELFLGKSDGQKRALFDLARRQHWWELSPRTREFLETKWDQVSTWAGTNVSALTEEIRKKNEQLDPNYKTGPTWRDAEFSDAALKKNPFMHAKLPADDQRRIAYEARQIKRKGVRTILLGVVAILVVLTILTGSVQNVWTGLTNNVWGIIAALVALTAAISARKIYLKRRSESNG